MRDRNGSVSATATIDPTAATTSAHRQPSEFTSGGMVKPADHAAERHAGLLDREHEVAVRRRREALQHLAAGGIGRAVVQADEMLAMSATASDGTR